MTVLVLGATGYLGGNIVSKLIRNGHKVICVVRPTSDLSRLDLEDEKIELISNDMNQIELTFKHKKIDWVINGVCTYKPNDSLYGDMLESNVIFPLSILNLAIKYHVKNYMTMGTGLPDLFNVYSYTKFQFSEFGRFLSEKDSINFLNLKLEMFYGGENEPTSRFLHDCKRKLIKNLPLELTEGIQERDVVRVEDIVRIITWLVEESPYKGYRDLPIGSGEKHSIRDIVSFMKNELQSSSELLWGSVKSREGEPSTCADMKWLEGAGISLEYNFWEGLKKYTKE